MCIHKSVRYWFMLLSLWSNLLTSLSAEPIVLHENADFNFPAAGAGAEQSFVLKNPYSGRVLDASEEWVRLQPFTGFKPQQWRLEAATGGQFYITNIGTGKVLDLGYRYPVRNSWVVVSNKIDQCMNECSAINAVTRSSMNIGACQKWHVHYGGIIVNACGKYAVDIRNENYAPGVYLETWAVTEKNNQKFIFSYL